MQFDSDEQMLIQTVEGYLESHEMPQCQLALPYAIEQHKGQTRNEGIPYIVHPLTMACHAIAMGMATDELLAVIILHDVCEDCGVDYDELPVNDLVRQGVYYMTCKCMDGETKAEAKQRYFHDMRASRTACLVKLFDRCHNVSTMAKAFSARRMKSYIQETKKYIYPLFAYIRESFPEYQNVVFLLEYHTKSAVESLENYVEY